MVSTSTSEASRSLAASGCRARQRLRAECPYSWAIRWGRQAHGTSRDCDHGNRVADHVEELDRVSFLGYAGHDVPLHDCANIAGAQATFDDIAGQNHVAVQLEFAIVSDDNIFDQYGVRRFW